MSKISTFWQKLFIVLSAAFFIQGVAFSQTTYQIGSGAATTTNLPLSGLHNYNYSQTIYTAEEMYAAGMYSSGEITKIRYKPTSSVSSVGWNEWEVYIGNTPKNSFGSPTDWIPVGNMTQVFNGTIITNINAAYWIELNLSSAFVWDGTSNLVIAVREKVTGSGVSPNWASYNAVGTNRAMYYHGDNTNPNPASPPDASNRTTNLAQIQFAWESNLPNCTGTPHVGSIPSSMTVCPKVPFSILVPGAQLNHSNYKGQWQSKVLPGGTWQNMTDQHGFELTLPQGITVETEYRFILTCTSSNLSDTTNEVTVSISPKVDLGPDTTLCIGGSLVLDAGADGEFYNWSHGAAGRYATITAPGTYSVIVEATNGCIAIDTIKITLSDDEVVKMDGIYALTLGGNSFKFSVINPENISEYFWTFGDGNFSADGKPTHTYATGGNYVVTVEVSNGCGSLSDTIPTHVVSVGEIDKDDPSILVYPNPSQGKIIVKNTSEYPMQAIYISDLSGRILQKIDVKHMNDFFEKEIDLNTYADGIYWINIQTEKGIFNKKINLIK